MKNKYPKISTNIVLLGIVSFLNDLSSEMIIPILPMFITALGGTGFTIGTSFVFKLFLAFSKTWLHILVFAGLERVGKGLRTAPRDAIIADSMPDQRGRGFGIHRALDTAGAISGSIVVFLLFWFLEFDFRPIILTAAIIAIISLIPLHFVKEKEKERQDITLKIGLKTLPRYTKLFILVAGLFALANFSYMFFILRAKEFFTGKLSIGVPILLYVLFNIFYAVFAIPFGNLSDKIGRKRVLILGYLLFSLTSLGFVLFNSLAGFVVLFAVYGKLQL